MMSLYLNESYYFLSYYYNVIDYLFKATISHLNIIKSLI